MYTFIVIGNVKYTHVHSIMLSVHGQIVYLFNYLVYCSTVYCSNYLFSILIDSTILITIVFLFKC